MPPLTRTPPWRTDGVNYETQSSRRPWSSSDQDWFDDVAIVSNLLAENCLHKAYVDCPTDYKRTASYRSRRFVQQRLREMQDAWTVCKAEEIQGYADHNQWKNFIASVQAVYDPTALKTQLLPRWAKKFRSLLNRPSTISGPPKVETIVDLDLPPSLYEAISAVHQPCSGKEPGSHVIPTEINKHGGLQLMDYLAAVFRDLNDSIIVHLYKRKGNRQLCDNHSGISLLNIAGKIFARILLNHLSNHLE
nr:unnamed protein product [Spirometra erinaceieuropaei]